MGVWSVTAVMVIVECLEVSLNTVSKAAMTKGMSDFVFVTYSNALAFFFLLPSSFIVYRRRSRPPLTWGLIGGVFVISAFSCMAQMFKAFGIGYSSPTLASVMSDLVPAFTFLLALIFRFEKLDLTVTRSRVRCAGTFVSISGALVVTIYKGLPITIFSLPEKVVGEPFLLMQPNWLLGGFLLSSNGLLVAAIFILQTRVIRGYPAELIVALLRCIFQTILSAIISLVAERNPDAWKLSFDVELIAIVCSALFSISIRFTVHLWACRKKGPVFVAMFKPLGIVIAVVMGVIFLGDTLHLGSVIGVAIVVLGFYAVIWGQAREKVIEDHPTSSNETTSPKVPLLQNKSTPV